MKTKQHKKQHDKTQLSGTTSPLRACNLIVYVVDVVFFVSFLFSGSLLVEGLAKQQKSEGPKSLPVLALDGLQSGPVVPLENHVKHGKMQVSLEEAWVAWETD